MERVPLSNIANVQQQFKQVSGNGTRFSRQTSFDAVKDVFIKRCCEAECCRQFTCEEIQKCRIDYWSKTQQQQRLYLFSSLRDAGCHKMLILGREVCEIGWKTLYSIGERRLWEIKKQIARKASAPYGNLPRLQKPSSECLQSKSWLESYARQFSERLPDKEEYRLPSCITKQAVYDLYKEDMMKANQNTLGRSSFHEMWQKALPDVKISKSKGGQARCTPCINMETVLLNMQLSKEVRKQIEEKRRVHLNLQSDCRSKYYKHIKKSCEYPEKYVSLIIDNMDQAKTRLPAFSSYSKVEAHLQKLQHHVTGVKAHHLGKTFILTWTDQFFPDSNITINSLVYTLHEISKRNGGTLPPTLYLQADNSGKDNKNTFIITFLAWLVKKGIFKKVKLSFLMVGHTHEDIDQVFSRISTHMRHVNAPTLPSMLHGITESTTPAPEVIQVKGIYDYKSCLEDVRGMIEGISGPHQFMLKEKNGKVILHYKDWPTDTVYKTLDFHDRIPDDFNLLQVAVNPKMEVEATKMINELQKWSQSGRLSEEDIDWWKDYLVIQQQNPNLPQVHQLPSYTQMEQTRNTETDHIVDAISVSVERHRKQSVLKVKGRRRARLN